MKKKDILALIGAAALISQQIEATELEPVLNFLQK